MMRTSYLLRRRFICPPEVRPDRFLYLSTFPRFSERRETEIAQTYMRAKMVSFSDGRSIKRPNGQSFSTRYA